MQEREWKLGTHAQKNKSDPHAPKSDVSVRNDGPVTEREESHRMTLIPQQSSSFT